MSSPPPVELAATLRRLREDAGLSGMEAARRAGLSQPTLSRLETGHRVPTADEINALCRTYKAPAAERRALIALVKDLKAETTSSRIVLHNPPKMQERIRRIEVSSHLLRGFQPSMVIGLVQTPGYIAAALGEVAAEHLDAIIRNRMERQELLDSDREFALIHTEGALYWHVGGPDVMAEQAEHLASLTDRPNLRIGVIPWDRPLSMPARHAFHVYDNRTVIVGTESGTAFITDPLLVKTYDRRFAELAAVAAFGDEARAVFERVAREYRSLT